MTAPSIARTFPSMDTQTTNLRDALRRVHGMLIDSRATVRMSDLRITVNDAARVAERALMPTEPTPLELRTALQALTTDPKVRQAVGAAHPTACGCAFCAACVLVGRPKGQ